SGRRGRALQSRPPSPQRARSRPGRRQGGAGKANQLPQMVSSKGNSKPQKRDTTQFLHRLGPLNPPSGGHALPPASSRAARLPISPAMSSSATAAVGPSPSARADLDPGDLVIG